MPATSLENQDWELVWVRNDLGECIPARLYAACKELVSLDGQAIDTSAWTEADWAERIGCDCEAHPVDRCCFGPAVQQEVWLSLTEPSSGNYPFSSVGPVAFTEGGSLNGVVAMTVAQHPDFPDNGLTGNPTPSNGGGDYGIPHGDSFWGVTSDLDDPAVTLTAGGAVISVTGPSDCCGEIERFILRFNDVDPGEWVQFAIPPAAEILDPAGFTQDPQPDGTTRFTSTETNNVLELAWPGSSLPTGFAFTLDTSAAGGITVFTRAEVREPVEAWVKPCDPAEVLYLDPVTGLEVDAADVVCHARCEVVAASTPDDPAPAPVVIPVCYEVACEALTLDGFYTTAPDTPDDLTGVLFAVDVISTGSQVELFNDPHGTYTWRDYLEGGRLQQLLDGLGVPIEYSWEYITDDGDNTTIRIQLAACMGDDIEGMGLTWSAGDATVNGGTSTIATAGEGHLVTDPVTGEVVAVLDELGNPVPGAVTVECPDPEAVPVECCPQVITREACILLNDGTELEVIYTGSIDVETLDVLAQRYTALDGTVVDPAAIREEFNCCNPPAPLAADDPIPGVMTFDPDNPGDNLVTFNVADNDKPCSEGVTTYVLIPGSEVNVTGVTPATSPDGVFTFEVTGGPDYSFDYEIYCDGVPSGEVATVSGQTAVGDIQLVKQVRALRLPAHEGDTVNFVFQVTNTGTVPLTNVVVNDPMLGLVNALVSPSTLNPGDTGIVSASYTVTNADVLAGQINNTASTSGEAPDGELIEDSASAGLQTIGDPALTLVKSPSAPGPLLPGQTVTYTFTVTNTGNVPLTTTIDDPVLGVAGLPVSPNPVPVGGTATASVVHTVTEAEAIAGEIDNTATADGTGPNGETASATDTATVATWCPLFQTGSWTQGGDTLTDSATGIAVNYAHGPGAEVTYTPNGQMNPAGATFWSEPLAGDTSMQFVYFWDTAPEAAGVDIDGPGDDQVPMTVTFTFPTPVDNPVLHFDRLGGSGGSAESNNVTLSNTSVWTLQDPYAISKLAGTDDFMVVGSQIYREPDVVMVAGGGESAQGLNEGTAAGSAQVTGENITSLTFVVDGAGVEGAGADGVEIIITGRGCF